MTDVLEAIALLDAVLGAPGKEQAAQERQKFADSGLSALGLAPWTMGGIATKGCPKCGGTMYRTQEPGGAKQWVCQNYKCGAVE